MTSFKNTQHEKEINELKVEHDNKINELIKDIEYYKQRSKRKYTEVEQP